MSTTKIVSQEPAPADFFAQPNPKGFTIDFEKKASLHSSSGSGSDMADDVARSRRSTSLPAETFVWLSRSLFRSFCGLTGSYAAWSRRRHHRGARAGERDGRHHLQLGQGRRRSRLAPLEEVEPDDQGVPVQRLGCRQGQVDVCAGREGPRRDPGRRRKLGHLGRQACPRVDCRRLQQGLWRQRSRCLQHGSGRRCVSAAPIFPRPLSLATHRRLSPPSLWIPRKQAGSIVVISSMSDTIINSPITQVRCSSAAMRSP